MPVPYTIGNPYIDADFSYLLGLISSTTSVVQLPAAAALGKAWHASGWLRRLAQNGISALEAVEQINAQVLKQA